MDLKTPALGDPSTTGATLGRHDNYASRTPRATMSHEDSAPRPRSHGRAATRRIWRTSCRVPIALALTLLLVGRAGAVHSVQVWPVNHAVAASALSATPMLPQLRVAGVALPGDVAATRWAPLFHHAHANVSVSVTPSSSNQGVAAFTRATADIALHSGPLTLAQLQAEASRCVPFSLVRVPLALDATALVVRLPDLTTPLHVTPSVLVALYGGVITRWNDPLLTALNPGVALPGLAVRPFYRSDGDRTTDVLRTYVRRTSPALLTVVSRVGASWPEGRGVTGEIALARAVATTPGGLGYLDLSTARAAHLPVIALLNKTGDYVAASATSATAAAIGAASDVRAGRTPDLIDATGEAAYPLTYPLVADACDGTSAEAHDVAAYLAAALSPAGQQAVTDAGDAALPPALRPIALAAFSLP